MTDIGQTKINSAGRFLFHALRDGILAECQLSPQCPESIAIDKLSTVHYEIKSSRQPQIQTVRSN